MGRRRGVWVEPAGSWSRSVLRTDCNNAAEVVAGGCSSSPLPLKLLLCSDWQQRFLAGDGRGDTLAETSERLDTTASSKMSGEPSGSTSQMEGPLILPDARSAGRRGTPSPLQRSPPEQCSPFLYTSTPGGRAPSASSGRHSNVPAAPGLFLNLIQKLNPDPDSSSRAGPDATHQGSPDMVVRGTCPDQC